MKKLILFFVFGIGIMFSMSSCMTPAYGQDVVISSSPTDNVDINVVIEYGTPYYYNGSLWYYELNGLCYYPYIRNGRYYFHRYSRPLPPPRHGHYSPAPRPHHGGSIHRNPPVRPHHGGTINHRPSSPRPHNGGNMGHRPSPRPHSGSGMHHGGRR